jgi:glucosamine kinase
MYISRNDGSDGHNGTGRYYVGVDGGGSKTLAIVVDGQGNEQGRGQAGSSNPSAVGREQATRSICAAVEEAARAAGCALPLRAAWFGLAGVDRPEDHNALLPALKALAEIIRITNDAELLLSALDNAVGVAVIAGTGSIALGRDAHGASTRAGGWGYIIGDEGSGYEMGRLALQAAAQAADGRGPQTVLLELILKHWNLSGPGDILGQVYPGGDNARIARLSALVLAAAREGDPVARKLVQHAVEQLALAALVVGDALDFEDERMPLALGGGLLVHEADLRTQVLRRIRRRRPIGQVVVVEQPALSAARASIHLTQASAWMNTPEAETQNA